MDKENISQIQISTPSALKTKESNKIQIRPGDLALSAPVLPREF